MISTVQAGFFTEVQGAVESSNGGILASINAFFTTSTCYPIWVLSPSACMTNNTRLRNYVDLNSCGTSVGLPGDNATFYSNCDYCEMDLSTDFTSQCIYDGANYKINATVYDANWASCCNVTGLDSDCYEDDSNNYNTSYYESQSCTERQSMSSIAIILGLVGVIFWLVYTANTLKTTNEAGQAVPINTMVKMLMYGFAGFGVFVVIQIAYGFSIANAFDSIITTTLRSNYSLMLYGGILLLFLILFGIIGNVSTKALEWFRSRFNPRKNRK